MSSLEDYATKYACAKCERRNGVIQVTLHTDGDSLIFSDSVHGELGLLFQDVADDHDNEVMILTGTGTSFCSKYNFGSFFHSQKPNPPEWFMRIHFQRSGSLEPGARW